MDISGIFRTLMFFFDKIIYSFIPTVYNFIMQLAGVSVFDEEKLDTIAKNLYALIGLFVIFRVAIVLLNAIVNPDKLDDKNEGAAKLITRFITALVLIVVIPIGFDVADDLQRTILKKQVINKVLIGRQDVSEEQPSKYGYQMAKTSLSAFLTCNETLTKIAEHEAETIPDGQPKPAKELCDSLERGLTTAFMPANGVRSFQTLDDILNTKENITPPGSEPLPYAYTYNSLISTVAGVIILLMLVTLCFDVAVRIVKLAFFEIMAPIAVIGYVDPKGDVFIRWLKAVGKTYLNLFIRIASISFVTLTLSMIDIDGGMKGLSGESLTGSTLTFAKIFIIIGLLIFAKELPNLLSEIFNIKDGGNILNPFKKLGSMAVVGGAAGSALGYAASGATKLAAGGLGALGGGVGSALRGGKFGSGMKEGGAAGLKSVKMGPKFGLGQVGKATFAGVTGGAAAFKGTSGNVGARDRQIKHMKDRIVTGGASSIFSNEGFKNAFTDLDNSKLQLKSDKTALVAAQNDYDNKKLAYDSAKADLDNTNNRFTQASQSLSNATSLRDGATNKAAQLKAAMESHAPAPGSVGSADYITARNNYNSFMSSVDYTKAMDDYKDAIQEYTDARVALNLSNTTYDVAKTNLMDPSKGAQKVLHDATAKVVKSTKDVDDAEKSFKVQQEAPENKKDADKYKVYKNAKDTGRL